MRWLFVAALLAALAAAPCFADLPPPLAVAAEQVATGNAQNEIEDSTEWRANNYTEAEDTTMGSDWKRGDAGGNAGTRSPAPAPLE